MKLIKEVEKRINSKGFNIRWGEFSCSFCNKLVKRILFDGLKQKSCGCIKNKGEYNASYKHGDTDTRLYRIYNAIKTRCNNPNSQAYKDYGGRGITICPEWAESYIVFRGWALSNGYSDNLEIDRWPNNDGNYEPSNCRWVIHKENCNNRRFRKVCLNERLKIYEKYEKGHYTVGQLSTEYFTSKSTIYRIINND